MLRGDVKTTPLPDLLKRLSDAKATGCVYVQPAGKRSMEATIGLRDGLICNVMLPGAEEAIGTRLVASRHLTPADLAEAREAQETELAAWTLAELLIHLGLADEQTVHALVVEQALAALTELCEWPSGNWRFRRRERTGPSLPSPLEIGAALETVAERQARWAALAETIHSADAVVSLAVHHERPEDDPNLEMDADSFALLCAVDGAKTVAELAAANGFTVLEAGDKISALVESGLVQVAHPSHDDLYDDELDERSEADTAEAVDTPDAAHHGLAAIAAAFAVDVDNDFPHAPIGAPWQAPRTASGDSLADALARVSAALSDAMVEPEVSEPDIEVEPAAVFEPEPDPVVVAEVEEQEAETEDVAEVEPEVFAEVSADVEVEPEVEAEDEEYLAAVIALPFAAAEPEVEVEPEPEVVEAELEVEAEPEPEVVEAELEVEAEPEPEVVEPEVETELAEFVAEFVAKPEPAAEVEPALEIEPVAEPIIEEALEVFAALASADEEAEPAVEHAETAHENRATAANAARLLSQFSEESSTPPAAEPEPEPEPEAPPAAPEGHAPRPRRENGFADTAALLRELSSLGTETNSLSAPRMPSSRPPTQPAANGGQHARKRKGLFGRG